jgi:hypothetical protein
LALQPGCLHDVGASFQLAVDPALKINLAR